MLDSISQNKIKSFYSDYLEMYGYNVKSMDWGSSASQQIRFQVLSEIAADLDFASILDIGCGLADMYAFLSERNTNIKYTGYDITPAMIAKAKSRFPQLELETVNVLEMPPCSQQYDYVFSSGMFNVQTLESEGFMHDAIDLMFKTCRKGLAFNALSIYAPSFAEERYYASPEKTFSFCKAICQQVVMRHDYRLNDFTIYMYKSEH